MAASTNLGPWGSKVHFTGSSKLDVERGGVIAYPVYGATGSATGFIGGSTLPFNDGILFFYRPVSTQRTFTGPAPRPGCHLDLIFDQGSSGLVTIDFTTSVGVVYGTTWCRYIIATSSGSTGLLTNPGPTSVELLGLTTNTWIVGSVSPYPTGTSSTGQNGMGVQFQTST